MVAVGGAVGVSVGGTLVAVGAGVSVTWLVGVGAGVGVSMGVVGDSVGVGVSSPVVGDNVGVGVSTTGDAVAVGM